MKALLLAAGVGSRLHSFTEKLPKCLMPINGVPLIAIWLEFLFTNGVDEVLINLHYLPDLVKDYIKTLPYSSRIQFSYEKELLGTGGTLKKHSDLFADESFLLIHADNLSIFDFKSFYQKHVTPDDDVELTMMVFDSKEPKLCGIVELNESERIVRFHEKVENPPGTLANAAVYWVKPTVLPLLEEINRDFVDVSTEILPQLMGKMNIYKNEIYHRDIGNPWSFLYSQREFLPYMSGFKKLPPFDMSFDYFVNAFQTEFDKSLVIDGEFNIKKFKELNPSEIYLVKKADLDTLGRATNDCNSNHFFVSELTDN